MNGDRAVFCSGHWGTPKPGEVHLPERSAIAPALIAAAVPRPRTVRDRKERRLRPLAPLRTEQSAQPEPVACAPKENTENETDSPDAAHHSAPTTPTAAVPHLADRQERPCS